MVILEINVSDSKFPKEYFLGLDEEDALKMASIMGYKTVSHRKLSEEEARSLGVGLIDEGIRAIGSGYNYFFLAHPEALKQIQRFHPVT